MDNKASSDSERRREKLKRNVASELILILISTSMLTLAFHVQRAEAQTWYFDFTITVTPEFPTPLDEVIVTVSFNLSNTNQVETFGPVSQVDNEFSVDIEIYVPQTQTPLIRHTEHSYSLGMLPEGSYRFTASVTVSGWGSGFEQYIKSFIVRWPTPIPEYPTGPATLLLLTAAIPLVYIWRTRRKTPINKSCS